MGNCFKHEKKHEWKQRVKRMVASILCSMTVLGVGVVSTPLQVNAAVVAQGIDVSKWQRAINWNAVAQNNVNFAFIRVGSLKTGIDEYFYRNIQGAQAAGIKTGVYIYSYATSVEQAAQEAVFVLEAIKNLKISYPIVWDIEDDVQQHLSKDTIALMANTFCAIIEQEGYYPMVYANKHWFTKKIGPIMYDKWVAQWGDSLDIPDASVWQYSSTGRVNGIAGNVDLNFALKDYSTSIVDTGWVARKGFFYFYKDYKMQRGWLDLGFAKYFLDQNGRMVTGWMPQDQFLYYFNPDGTMARGLTLINNQLFFFNDQGHMLVGLQELAGLTFYFGETGVMHTGFLDLPDGRRYFEVDGHMVTGLHAIDGKLYFFDSKGRMLTGLQELNGLTYLFGADGVMYTGWWNDGVNVKYFETDGHMVFGGLVSIGTDVYYFDANGNMQTGVIDIGGTPFVFGSDGKLVTN